MQNYVASSSTGEIIYTPPPPHDVAPMMHELVQWLNDEKAIHPVLLAGIAQFQLVHIHSFMDGNGRTSRLLSTLCLYRAGYDFKKLFTLSQYYDRDRVAFYSALQAVRENDMDLTGWLNYFIEGLSTQLLEVRARGEAALRSESLGRECGLNARQVVVLEYLIEHGSLGIQALEKLVPTASRRTLQRDLGDLVQKKLLVAQGETNNATYVLHPSPPEKLAPNLRQNL